MLIRSDPSLLLSLYASSLIDEIRCDAMRGVKMKTYALFSSTGKEPLQTYEGEEMVQNKEYVSIYKRLPRQNSPIPKQVLVAAIHLGPGQSVKIIFEPHSDAHGNKMALERK